MSIRARTTNNCPNFFQPNQLQHRMLLL